jgi:hypothetical protein
MDLLPFPALGWLGLGVIAASGPGDPSFETLAAFPCD